MKGGVGRGGYKGLLRFRIKSPNAEQSPYSEQAISAKWNEKLAICLHLKRDLLFLFACAKNHRGP